MKEPSATLGKRPDVVEDFGNEWSRFDQSSLQDEEGKRLFDAYFSVFPWEALPSNARGFDLGCGSGRWAHFMAPRVGELHCIEPSAAVDVARTNLAQQTNVVFHNVPVENFPKELTKMDFGYSLGVLHHVDDTAMALRRCVEALNPGAPFLLYLYYALDNRPGWYRQLWKASDRVRRVVSELPAKQKHIVADAIASTVYLPLSRFARVAERLGVRVDDFPLAAYRNLSFYTLRTDALDRFGTRLEKRYTRGEIRDLMQGAGLGDIRFHEDSPFWCAVGRRES